MTTGCFDLMFHIHTLLSGPMDAINSLFGWSSGLTPGYFVNV